MRSTNDRSRPADIRTASKVNTNEATIAPTGKAQEPCRCACCGRPLSAPTSVLLGLGRVCWQRIFRGGVA